MPGQRQGDLASAAVLLGFLVLTVTAAVAAKAVSTPVGWPLPEGTVIVKPLGSKARLPVRLEHLTLGWRMAAEAQGGRLRRLEAWPSTFSAWRCSARHPRKRPETRPFRSIPAGFRSPAIVLITTENPSERASWIFLECLKMKFDQDLRREMARIPA